MEHHSNYFSSDLSEEEKMTFKAAIAARAITGPAFVGCGWSRRVGSDTYGGYVVSITKAKNGKPIIGICHCHSEMHGSWVDGDMDCCLPDGATDPKLVKPTSWITTYGTNKKTGRPKWWFCNAEGKRAVPGVRCSYSWGGCYEYRDPSF